MSKEIEKFSKELKNFLDSIEDPERKERLERYQWRLDQDLAKYKDPVARYNRMVELFWEGLQNFKEALENPSSLIDKEEVIPDNVVKFKKD
jgi:hypothetical protein